MREPIVIEWEDWRASRAMKREVLRRAGLDAPSRRKNAVGTADLRLRRAFGGARVPGWAVPKERGRQDWQTSEADKRVQT